VYIFEVHSTLIRFRLPDKLVFMQFPRKSGMYVKLKDVLKFIDPVNFVKDVKMKRKSKRFLQ